MQSVKYRLRRFHPYRRIQLAYTAWRANHGGLPNWRKLLAQDLPSPGAEPCRKGGSSGRVLIATGAGGHLTSMTLESMLGVALAQRGAGIDFLLCDGLLRACMMCEVNWYHDLEAFARTGPADKCDQCHPPALRMLEQAGFVPLAFSGFVTAEERAEAARLASELPAEEIGGYRMAGVSIGEHALAGTLRFFACARLDGTPETGTILRRYFESALLAYFAARRLLGNGNYRVVVLNHGIYVPQGIVAETARSLGIRVVTWHLAYRKSCFIFNHDETYHHGLLSESVSAWEDMHWNDAQARAIAGYLESRRVGGGDWVKFHRKPEFDLDKIGCETGIDFSRPTIGLLTNVAWDAQLHYRANAFPNMMDWILKTIAFFASRPELQLLIRVHPAEVTGTIPSRQRVTEEIEKAYPLLPNNVFVIPPDSQVSTYVAMVQCNAALIYGTKMGVELSAIGIPVIVAGEAWVRGKGITHDAESEVEYFELLRKLPFGRRLDEETRQRALKYAYHFFFRRMIPIDCMRPSRGWPPFRVVIRSLNDLAPGKSLGLDVVCEGILEGTPFIYPAELHDEQVSQTAGVSV